MKTGKTKIDRNNCHFGQKNQLFENHLYRMKWRKARCINYTFIGELENIIKL